HARRRRGRLSRHRHARGARRRLRPQGRDALSAFGETIPIVTAPGSTTTAEPASTNPFRIPAFSLFFTGRVLTTLAGQAQAVAVAWQVYAIARERGFDVK